MNFTRIVAYTLIIITIILSLLLSILNFEDPLEFVIAKWAICGILSIVVIGVSLADLRFFSRDHYGLTLSLAIRAIAIPMIIIAITSVFFELIQRGDLLEKVLLQAPFLPVFIIFMVSVGTHMAYVFFRNKKPRN